MISLVKRKGGISAFFKKYWFWFVLLIGCYFLIKKIPSFLGMTHTQFNLNQDLRYPLSLLSSQQVATYSNRLYTAMNGFGTDTVEIQSVFDVLTVNDTLRVYNHFGLRKYTMTLTVPSPELDLCGWLNEELSHSDSAYISAYNKLHALSLI